MVQKKSAGKTQGKPLEPTQWSAGRRFIIGIVGIFGFLFFVGFISLVIVNLGKKDDAHTTARLPNATRKEGTIIFSSDTATIPEERTFTSMRDYEWNYKGLRWHISLSLSEELYKKYKDRSRQRKYDLFASDPYDDVYIKDVARALRQAAIRYNFPQEELPYLTASFVQSLPYTADNVTTPFDDYPRFSYETLHENGGDCEDTSILAVSILQDMGYGAVLIHIPGHMAVGLQCATDVPGYRYTYQGKEYCYLETTGENWPVGDIPPEFKNLRAEIIPVYKRPFFDIRFNFTYTYDARDVYVDVDVYAKNSGSQTAENAKMYVALETPDTTKVWDQIASEPLYVLPEKSFTYKIKNLHAPAGKNFRVYVQAQGTNIVADEAKSDWITWEKSR